MSQTLISADPLAKLVLHFGSRKRAADAIGVSPSNFTRWAQTGLAAVPFVLAAQKILDEANTTPTATESTFLIRTQDGEFIRQLLTRLGVAFSEV